MKGSSLTNSATLVWLETKQIILTCSFRRRKPSLSESDRTQHHLRVTGAHPGGEDHREPDFHLVGRKARNDNPAEERRRYLYSECTCRSAPVAPRETPHQERLEFCARIL